MANTLTGQELIVIENDYKDLRTALNSLKGYETFFQFIVTGVVQGTKSTNPVVKFIFNDSLIKIKNYLDDPFNTLIIRGLDVSTFYTLTNLSAVSTQRNPKPKKGTIDTDENTIRRQILEAVLGAGATFKTIINYIDVLMDDYLKPQNLKINDVLTEINNRISAQQKAQQLKQQLQTPVAGAVPISTPISTGQGATIINPIDLKVAEEEIFKKFAEDWNNYVTTQFAASQKVSPEQVPGYDIQNNSSKLITALNIINKKVSTFLNTINTYNQQVDAGNITTTEEQLKITIQPPQVPANAVPVQGTDKKVYKILESINKNLSYNVNKVIGKYFIPGLNIITVSMDGIQYKVEQGGKSRLYSNHRDVQDFVYKGAFEKDKNPYKEKYISPFSVQRMPINTKLIV